MRQTSPRKRDKKVFKTRNYIPKTRPSSEKQREESANESASRIVDRGAMNTGQAAKDMLKLEKQRIQQGKSLFTSRARKQLWESSKVVASHTAEILAKAGMAFLEGVKTMISAGMLGSTALVACMGILLVIGLLAASPFGIFFSNERDPDAISLTSAVAQINGELNSELSALQEDDYDSVSFSGSAPQWAEVISVFACRSMEDNPQGTVSSLDASAVELLRSTFWDMCLVSKDVEVIDHPDTDPEDEEDDSWEERNLFITVSGKTAGQMESAYGFSDEQKQMLSELLSHRADIQKMLTSLTVSQVDAAKLISLLPRNLSPIRRRVVENALSLAGKVSYFWGGKSLTLGWDSRWGQMALVWADGSVTTGTYRPFGLDCSGFVDWAIYNASYGDYVIGHGGGVISQHYYCEDVSWAEALPGDLVFYPGDEHIGILVGMDENGILRVVECAAGGYNGVVITDTTEFLTAARPFYYDE